ncbi:MAG TPA: autotransporter-associated beta strand repeat-containing protein [Candidatus Dormibacteraeota bacterium]|nr:autotransporter-associated beta strand repeat-containing protein [Candidatus Dormibacteraeota bacterium]
MKIKEQNNRTAALTLSKCLLTCAVVLSAATTFAAATTRTWMGIAGDNLMGTSANWNPVAVPSSSANDTLQWNGSIAGNLLLTNSPANFDSNPGFNINVTAGQVGSVSIVESNAATGRIRLNGTNTFNLATGAGAFSFGIGSSTPLPIALAGRGNGETHPFTNNSANPVTFASESYYVMGGGGAHTMILAGPGPFVLNSSFQAQNSGGSLGLTVSGSGIVNLIGAPAAVVYGGNYGNVTLNSGTFQVGSAGALGIGNTLVFTGGNLDSTVPSLVNSGNNPQNWNGNFTFLGTQSLDLGFGPITMNASRIITVNANTLTVGGGIAGNNFSLTKAGAGTLAVNGANTYTGGTVISNGVLQLGNAAGIPSGTATAASVTNYGTLDLNGNSPFISSLSGSGIVDTVSGGAPTLSVGANDASSAFTGTIRNTVGSLALSKTGIGTFTLGGASTYGGGTTVGSGTLLITNATGSATGSGAVTVNSAATFGGSGIVGGSVEWQGGSVAIFTQGSPLTVNGSVTLNGNAVTVNVPGATPLGAGTYTLMTYNNSGSSGSFATVGVAFIGAGVSAGSSVSLTTGSGLVQLIVAAPPGLSATWTNNGNGNWSVGANWSSNPRVPQNAGEVATLGQGSAFTTVTLDIPVTNGFLSFNNTNSFSVANAGNPLTFDNTNGGAALIIVSGSSNSIAAPVSLNDALAISAFPGSFAKISGNISSTTPDRTLTITSGSGTVALSGNNTYGPPAGSIGTIISGSGTSTLELDSNNALSAGDLSISRPGTIRAGAALTVPNNVIISNTVTASVDNNGNNLTLSGTISGGGAFAKNGAGTLTLTGANSYNGDTSVSAGTIKLGNVGGLPGGTGNGNVNMGTNTTLDLNGFSPILNGLNSSIQSATVDNVAGGAVTLTLGESGSFATFNGNIKNTAGSVALVKDGTGNQTLGGTNNTFTGGTTINAGILRVGNGNTNTTGLGTIVGLGTGPVLDNGTLEFNMVGTNTFTNIISGSGALNTANNSLSLVLGTTNTFTGDVNVNNGALWLKNSRGLGATPKPTGVHVQNGTAGNSQLHLDGTAGNIDTEAGIDFWLSNVGGVLFNEAGSNTLRGSLLMPFGGGAAYVIVKSGFLTLTGDAASDGVANGRILQLGGGGKGLYSGSVYNTNNLSADIQKTDAGTWTVTGASTSLGTLSAIGGVLIFNGSWTGPVAVNSGGTLAGTGTSLSNLTVNAGGKFVPGNFGSIGTFTVGTNLVMSGTNYFSLNKSLGQPNSFVQIPGGAVANAGSSLVVSNLGPALVGGDRFFLFSQAVTNGANMTITGPVGVPLHNNLAVDGSISVVNTTPTNMNLSLVGNQLNFSWPTDHTGWHLQAQTNSVIGTNWVTITGTDSSNGYTLTIDPANSSVFFRMIYP